MNLYFFRDNFFQSLHNYINIEVPGRQISLEELTIIVLDECREGHLKLSDFVIQNLVIHIAPVISPEAIWFLDLAFVFLRYSLLRIFSIRLFYGCAS